MQLFNDENLIVKSNEDKVILTSHRISYNDSSFASTTKQTIMLEHITSCESKETTKTILLVLVIVCLVLLFISTGGGDFKNLGPIGMAGAILFGVFYFKSKRSSVIISSPSTKIVINTKGMKSDAINRFIDQVEKAKHERLMSISKHGH